MAAKNCICSVLWLIDRGLVEVKWSSWSFWTAEEEWFEPEAHTCNALLGLSVGQWGCI